MELETLENAIKIQKQLKVIKEGLKFLNENVEAKNTNLISPSQLLTLYDSILAGNLKGKVIKLLEESEKSLEYKMKSL